MEAQDGHGYANWRRLPVTKSVPPWVGKTPSSHRLFERGRLFACAACGGIGAFEPQKLLRECNRREGHLEDAYKLIRAGKLSREHSR